jgi:hemolysin III
MTHGHPDEAATDPSRRAPRSTLETASPGAAPTLEDPAPREIAEAVAESGGTSEVRDEDLPTAEDFPFAPRTLTRAMARRATQLGLQLPKPRLRGMLHLIAFPTTLVIGLLLVAVGDTLLIRLACATFVLTAAMLFGISAVYHRGTWTPQRAIILRRFDHANIFLIIAGTYTPIAAALLAPRQAATLLAIAWGGALIGVCFRIFWTGGGVLHAAAARERRLGRGGAAGRGRPRLHRGSGDVRAQAPEPVPRLVRVPRDLPRRHADRLRLPLRGRGGGGALTPIDG